MLLYLNIIAYITVVILIAKFIIKLDTNIKTGAIIKVVAISIVLTIALSMIPTDWTFAMGLSLFVAIIAVVCVFNKGKLWHNILYSVAMFWAIGMLGRLARDLVSVSLEMVGLQTEQTISEILAFSFIATFILILSRTLKTRYGLKDVTFRYNVLICVIISIDSICISMLGIVLSESTNIGRKWLVELVYIFTVLGVFVQLGLLVAMILSRDEHKEKEALNAKYLEDQVAHYEYLEKREQETRKFRHDMTNHMMILRNLYDTGTEAEFEEYFDTISKRITAFGNQISVGNNTADAIINQYAQEAENAGIKLKVDGHFSPDCHISAVDICTIFSNLLSNAIRAEKEANGEEVELFIRNLDQDLFIEVRNDYVTQVKRSGERFISTKEDRANHGLGLQNVYDCVERNHGVIHITTDHQIFDVKLNLKNTEA